jgi:DNA-binding protein H-NS
MRDIAEPRYSDDPTEQLDALPAHRNNWKLATIGLIGVVLLVLIGVGMFFLGQSTRMSHGEVAAQEHRLVSTAVQQRASQDAASEQQAIARAVVKQKTHDQQVAKKETAHARSVGESTGRAQGESSGKAQGESSGKTYGETVGRLNAESETTKLAGHDSEGYAYGTLPSGQECDDNPRVPLPAC